MDRSHEIPFLHQVARQLLTDHPVEDMPRLVVILPSRRACRYFKYYLGKAHGKPLFAPKVLSIFDFISELSGLVIIDKIDLLFRLYRTYKRFDTDPLTNLERFAPLGTQMLKDFDLIDMNLSQHKAEGLFAYLQDVKAIERWASELGDEKELKWTKSLDHYFQFWENLRQTYLAFRSDLETENKGYHGMGFRWVYNQLEKLLPQLKENYKQLVFAGFSQLTHVEFQIIERLHKELGAQLFWDTDAFYTENPAQEAGEYFRIFRKNYIANHPDFHKKHIGKFPQSIELVKTGEPVTQVKWLAKELEQRIPELSATGEPINRIGILLPDESLLTPLLHSLPDVEFNGKPMAAATNVTMGLPFGQSGVFHWLELWFRLHLNSKGKDGKTKVFYHQDVNRLLSHPFSGMSETQQATRQSIKDWLLKENIIYPYTKALAEKAKGQPLLGLYFSEWKNDFKACLQQLKKGTQELFDMLQKHQPGSPEKYYVQELYGTLGRLEEVLGNQEEAISLKTFRQFLFEILKGISVPFTGEPIGPVQIMGMLESRSLDFEEVYILSCNDGLLPKKKSIDSLIPLDLRLQFGLPTYRENDASFAYTFYRLFHRAKKVTLVYSDPHTHPERGEMSRFLWQIREEFQQFKNIHISEKAVGLEVTVQQLSGPTIQKDAQILQRTKASLEKGKSPSAIISYLYSPLEFYFNAVLGLKEEQVIEESLDQRTLGILIHDTLEHIFQPDPNVPFRIWEKEDLEELLKRPNFIAQELQKTAKSSEDLRNMPLDTGKNYLLYEVAKQQLGIFFQRQQAETPFRIVLVEEFLSWVIPVTLKNGETLHFRLAGKADRVDLVGNQLRVVDYKTGNFKKDKLKADSATELFVKPEKSKIIQLMLYKYLLLKELQTERLQRLLPPGTAIENLEVLSGFYFFQQLSAGFIAYDLKGDEPPETGEFFTYVEQFISDWVNDVMRPDQPFSEQASEWKGL